MLIQLMQKHRSKINKGCLGRWSWSRFYINKKNQLMSKIMNNQPAPLPQPSSILLGNQIHISVLDASQKQFSVTLEEKCQYKWMLILSTRTENLKSTFIRSKLKPKIKYFKVNRRMKINSKTCLQNKSCPLITWLLK